MKRHYEVVAVSIFVFFIVLAHCLSTNGYDWMRNTISDLGAQGYGRKAIMQIGFLAFGICLTVGIIANGFSWSSTPIFIYGLCVGLTGIFCTKPFFDYRHYSEMQAALHAALAQIAGVAFTLGIILQLWFTHSTKDKLIHIFFLAAVVILSASFGLSKNYQGIFQRLLYLTSFIWLVRFFRP
ncbi:MAG TPA: DUF998 domain-containing protein [Chryseosolibacter sp.]